MFPYIAGEYNRPSFKPIPEGIYKVKILRPKEIENKQHTAKGINVSFSVVEGQYLGRLVFDSFYIEHQNKDFEAKEQNRFNGVLDAIQRKIVHKALDLDNQLLTIKVKIRKASTDGQFPEKNEVVDYFPYNYSEGDDNRTSDIHSEDIPF